MSADLRFKSFVDRILRLKEEQDALAADIREVYAEAKGDGYDKTVMGSLVSFLRKVDKDGAGAVEERQMAFVAYLDAYQRASGTIVALHAHTHEADVRFDAETGEIEDTSQSPDLANPLAHAKPVPAESLGDKISAPITNLRRSSPDADKAETVLQQSGPAVSVTSSSEQHPPALTIAHSEPDFEPPAFLTRAEPKLNNDCLKPETCKWAKSQTRCASCNDVALRKLRSAA